MSFESVVAWFFDVVWGSDAGIDDPVILNIFSVVFVIFGCAAVLLTLAFVFKFLLKLVDR